MSWDSDYGYGYVKPKYDIYRPKQKHEWKPTLLLMSTVYNCKYCGVKKEEVKDEEYCEDPNDTGGW